MGPWLPDRGSGSPLEISVAKGRIATRARDAKPLPDGNYACFAYVYGAYLAMVGVVGSAEFDEWFQALDDTDTDAVARVVDMLEMQGPALPFPYQQRHQGVADRNARTARPIGRAVAPNPLRLRPTAASGIADRR